MKTTRKLKALALYLSMAMGMLLPTSTFAQSEDFFRPDIEDNDFRDASWLFTVTNQNFGDSPVGSGLFVLTAAGVGYVVMKRKRAKRIGKRATALLFAGLMMLGLTDCRKRIVEPVVDTNGKAFITVKVNNGSRTDVTSAGVVVFQNGDKLYVGNNGAWRGTLEYSNGLFSGDITTTGMSNDDFLHFYLLGGNLTPKISGEEYSVVIANQINSYPVISCGTSTEKYSGMGTYETFLYNKCSLVKFNVDTPSEAPISITGMKNKVTINFSDNSIAYDQDGEGLIKMRAKNASNETWAIVLPQNASPAGSEGTAYSFGYIGNRPSLPAIGLNEYIGNSSAIDMSVKTTDESKILNLATVVSDRVVADGFMIIGTLDVENYPVKISIADGATVNLNGITISGVNNASCLWAGITCEGDATIILSGTNAVKGFSDMYSGVYVPVGKTLTIQGDGSLHASSNGVGAGIGACSNIACGNIVIRGGSITAEGGVCCAGIGGGQESNCGDITIENTVNYVYVRRGANTNYSIGAGKGGSCGTVTIGGDVTGPITINPYFYPQQFTVNGSGKKVIIAHGNLKVDNGTYSFQSHDYDVCFPSNSSTWNADLRDLFEITETGTIVSSHPTIDGHNDWRLLTNAEAEYLIQTRTNAASLYKRTTVAGRYGLIIMPDNWPGVVGDSYDEGGWLGLSSQGGVFLPASGYCWNNNLSYVGEHGYYRTSIGVIRFGNTSDANDNPQICTDAQDSQGYRSIRLVRDLN